MNRKMNRSRRLAPTWRAPLAPARHGCAKMSSSASGSTPCRRLPGPFRSTIAPKTPTTHARAVPAADTHQRALDRIPKNEHASQAA